MINLIKMNNYKTFHFKDLTIEVYPEVYDPAEDTFQLIESIDVKKGENVLEIGCGCGIISLLCARKGADVVCTDINPYAVKNTKGNYKKNKEMIKQGFEVRKGDLFSVLKPNEIFDVIIFNPPYLPLKEEDNIVDTWFNRAVDGGKTGLKNTKKFILQVSKYLDKKGRAYFVFSSLSNKENLYEIISKTTLKYDIVSSNTYDNEKIEIIRLKKQ